MKIKTFIHQLKSGENVKFTISETSINGKTCYYANVVNTDLDFYKELNEFEKENYLGATVSNGKQECVYYVNLIKLENDLKAYYGEKWLKSDI